MGCCGNIIQKASGLDMVKIVENCEKKILGMKRIKGFRGLRGLNNIVQGLHHGNALNNGYGILNQKVKPEGIYC